MTWFLHCSALLFGLLLLRLSQKHRNPCGMSKVFSGILLQKTWRSQPSKSPPLISHPPLFLVSLSLYSHLNRLLTRIPSSRLPGSSLSTLLGSNSYCPVKHGTDICSPRAFQDLPLKANEGPSSGMWGLTSIHISHETVSPLKAGARMTERMNE